MRPPAISATVNIEDQRAQPFALQVGQIQTNPASNAAPDGLGSPSKYRLSAVSTLALKRARRIATHAA